MPAHFTSSLLPQKKTMFSLFSLPADKVLFGTGPFEHTPPMLPPTAVTVMPRLPEETRTRPEPPARPHARGQAFAAKNTAFSNDHDVMLLHSVCGTTALAPTAAMAFTVQAMKGLFAA